MRESSKEIDATAEHPDLDEDGFLSELFEGSPPQLPDEGAAITAPRSRHRRKVRVTGLSGPGIGIEHSGGIVEGLTSSRLTDDTLDLIELIRSTASPADLRRILPFDAELTYGMDQRARLILPPELAKRFPRRVATVGRVLGS